MQDQDALRQTALSKLRGLPSRAKLFAFISWLDIMCAGASPDSLAQQILARAIIAAGYGLMEKRFLPTVQVTIEAAEAYVLAPTDEHFERYVIAATNSYPFGSGEGCYAIAELGYEGCALGSGCGSGAGSLGSFAAELGDAVVMELIAAELIPWLREEGDPVASRVLPRRSVGRGAVA